MLKKRGGEERHFETSDWCGEAKRGYNKIGRAWKKEEESAREKKRRMIIALFLVAFSMNLDAWLR